MSEISQSQEKRLTLLLELSHIILKTGNASTFINNNQAFIASVVPSDFIVLFDQLIKEGWRIDELKVASNKVINIFNKAIFEHKALVPQPDTFLDILMKNNATMLEILREITTAFKAYSKDEDNVDLIVELIRLFERLERFSSYYVIKENVLFPVIESNWSTYRYLQIMWSFHDDVRRNIRYILTGLRNGIKDTRSFNRSLGDIFFNMRALKFREEKILFPTILETMSEKQLEQMNYEGALIGYPYHQAKNITKPVEDIKFDDDILNLKTGELSLEQIVLLFNHLPLDITFVDESNKVRYFSEPKKRIFPRTTAVIGREVKNCHPPESVHVVEQIIEAFRSGEKDDASFWIKMGEDFILIKYFAVRDANNIYRGVLEIAQEITDIKALEGEKRLLDW